MSIGYCSLHPMQAQPKQLVSMIKLAGHKLGFQQIGIANLDIAADETHLLQWLARGRHGDMHYMARHGTRRTRPRELRPQTLCVISARMDYLPAPSRDIVTALRTRSLGYISRYATGRDYHRLLRRRLQKLADQITQWIGPFGYRVFVDSAPVLEKALARNAGLGWIGKHTNLINPGAGSWFFLGEVYIDLLLPVDAPFANNHCGSCTACIEICPTQAIIGPYQLDARRCIAYLTIELQGSIPVQYRPLIGNRIFGCDDCQLVCPWNKFAKKTVEPGFALRTHLISPRLVELFQWSEADFRQYTEGSAIRRIGYIRWLRNVAVALGNAPSSPAVIHALQARLSHSAAIVREHTKWALSRHA